MDRRTFLRSLAGGVAAMLGAGALLRSNPDPVFMINFPAEKLICVSADEEIAFLRAVMRQNMPYFDAVLDQEAQFGVMARLIRSRQKLTITGGKDIRARVSYEIKAPRNPQIHVPRPAK